jgi:hypothetical protein
MDKQNALLHFNLTYMGGPSLDRKTGGLRDPVRWGGGYFLLTILVGDNIEFT